MQTLGAQAVDAVIVGRGGGSMEDLWAFNEEAVVRAVRACPVPVVSAVGHETDFTLCDFAADARAATPSNAAELLVPDVRDALQRLDGLRETLRARTLRAIAEREGRLSRLAARVQPAQALSDLAGREKELGALRQRLGAQARAALAAREADFGRAQARLAALDPQAVLRRGYAAVRRGREPILRADQVRPEDELFLRFAGGGVSARALAVFLDNDEGE